MNRSRKIMQNNAGRPKARKGTFKRILKYSFEDYGALLILEFVLLGISAVINVIPATYIKTIVSIMEKGYDLIRGGLTGPQAYTAVVPELQQAIILIITVYAVGLIVSTTNQLLGAHITQGVLYKMRKRMFNKMQSLPIKFFDTHNHGDVMSHYTNDIETLRQLISASVPTIFQSSLTLIVLVSVMMYYSVWLTLAVFAGMIIIMMVTKFIGGNSAKYFVKQQKSLGKVEGFIEEMMNGQKVIKVFCHEEASKKDFDKLNGQLCNDATKANKFGNIMGPIMGNIGNFLYVIVAFVGGILYTVPEIPNISIASLINPNTVFGVAIVATFLGMTKQFTNQISGLAQQVSSIAMAMAGADRILTMLDEEPEIDDGYVTLVNAKLDRNENIMESDVRTGLWAWRHPHENGTVTYTLVEGDIVFDHVDFAYTEGKTVLHDITLYAKPGQKVALVGATGAGKTTITNLINRFYSIADGKVRYDGININKIKKSDLRRSLGIVLQDVNLFTGTVMENIRYGNLYASDEDCIEAAKLVNADGFIRMLPDGYNTMLKGDGSGLSQGQRQLISIARAAVADPPVMILDEATSSIDTRTESIVQKGMDALMKGRTVFVIAHRLSTVRNSDVIMVLDHGKIIERGTHEKLISEKGTYYRLYTGAFELE